MSFIETIIETNDTSEAFISQIKISKLPLVFYGAGMGSKHHMNFLKHHQVQVEKVVVSKILSGTQSLFCGYEISTINKAFEQYEEFDVFLSFGLIDVIEIRKKLNESGKVKHIYSYDATFNLCDSNHYNMPYSWVIENIECLEKLYASLADNISRQCMTAFFNQRISGDYKYFNEIKIEEQYFPDIIKLSPNEVFVDCGAYTGDSVLSFIKHMNGVQYKKIISFEPSSEAYQKLEILKSNIHALVCVNKGTWKEKSILTFDGYSLDVSGNFEIEVDTIDNICKNNEVTYIKMDVEGAEYETLQGAKETIKKYKPKIAASVYHKTDDLIKIPELLKALVPNYKLYLRPHRYDCFDFVLYAMI